MLTEAVVISLLGLVPQTTRVLAVELTVLGVAGWVFALVLFVRRPRDVAGPTKGQQVGQFVLGQMATLPAGHRSPWWMQHPQSPWSWAKV